MMLPLVAGLGALLLANPLRGGKRRASAHARQLRRCTKAARVNKRTKGCRAAFIRSVQAQHKAFRFGIKRSRACAAVERGIRQGRHNPIRGGKHRAAAHARQLRRVVRSARAFESRTGDNFGRFGAFKWALKSQSRAKAYGVKQARIVAAAKRGTRQKKRNPVKMSPGLVAKFAAALGGVGADHGTTMLKRWNALWAHNGSHLTKLAYAEGLNDNHIDAVLRRVIGSHSRNPTFDIHPGDRVTIRTPHGQQRTGRAVMRGSEAGTWVLNLGGAHGTPGIATPGNIVRVAKGKRRGGILG